VPGLIRGQDVPVGELVLGVVLGGGGQGQVVDVLNHPELVYKRYILSGVDEAALSTLITLPASMPRGDADFLERYSAWPFARVVDAGAVCGFLMPKAPAEFVGNTGAGPKLRQVQYLLYPPKPLWGDIAPLGEIGRIMVILKFTMLVKILHSHDIVLGDISMNNVLWSPGDDPGIFLIDCDGARRQGEPSPLPQPDTPDWNDPLCPSTQADLDSDRYKLALFIGRVLAASADTRPGQRLSLPPSLDERFAATVTDFFHRAGGARGTRPSAQHWLNALSTRRDTITLPPLQSTGGVGATETLAPITNPRGPRGTIVLNPVPPQP
jgi:DNA-binding helix-hairpin-helix protein with protein kinase domain